jgi:hypothetical protein
MKCRLRLRLGGLIAAPEGFRSFKSGRQVLAPGRLGG